MRERIFDTLIQYNCLTSQSQSDAYARQSCGTPYPAYPSNARHDAPD